MKPGTIQLDHGQNAQGRRINRWLQANGCRHYVPANARIIITGNRAIVPTFDIERVEHHRNSRGEQRPWYLNLTDAWFKHHDRDTLPIRVRTYRIRYDLKDVR